MNKSIPTYKILWCSLKLCNNINHVDHFTTLPIKPKRINLLQLMRENTSSKSMKVCLPCGTNIYWKFEMHDKLWQSYHLHRPAMWSGHVFRRSIRERERESLCFLVLSKQRGLWKFVYKGQPQNLQLCPWMHHNTLHNLKHKLPNLRKHCLVNLGKHSINSSRGL